MIQEQQMLSIGEVEGVSYYSSLSAASEAAIARLIVEGNVEDISAYVSELNSLGLSELIRVYQNRYDRYID